MSRPKKLYWLRFSGGKEITVWVGRPISFKTFLTRFVPNFKQFKDPGNEFVYSLQTLNAVGEFGLRADYELYPELTMAGELRFP